MDINSCYSCQNHMQHPYILGALNIILNVYVFVFSKPARSLPSKSEWKQMSQQT